VALQLKRAGITKVRPLEGGFEAWRRLGLPVEPLTMDDDPEAAPARLPARVE
jgi:3-mercaptopyruvate sulfurtransferase SseA